MVYVPTVGAANTPVLVSLFGNSRRWEERVAAFVPACAHHGVTLLAPCMMAMQAYYRRLGRDDQRADLFLHDCLRELSLLTGAETTRFSLFGHSGGAQFAHRYVLAHPHRVHAAVMVSAGRYTFPDTARKFPNGIRPTRRLPGIAFNPEDYLRVPMTVIVGSDDTAVAPTGKNERIVPEQGATRLERARRWVSAIEAQAAAHGMPSRVSLVEIPGVAGAFSDMCCKGALVERAFLSLF
jgi:pimeloyl-ACP methyl ester carboxylesterase